MNRVDQTIRSNISFVTSNANTNVITIAAI